MSDGGRETEGDEVEGGGLPHPIYNWQSAFGATLAAIGIAIAAFLFAIDVFTPDRTGYAGLALLPPLLLAALGCVLIGTGWLRERRRQRRGERSSFFDRWVVDPFAFIQRTRPWVVVAGIAIGTVALVGAGAGSVAVVGYSESNAFCSDVCHQVMGPEATTHAATPHARVKCVECHVGAGAEGFLEAKIGGLRQLWAVTAGTVERPIPTPVHGAPIDRKLCERCHTLNRSTDYQTLTRSYFLNGMEDVPVELTMLVKTGGRPDGLHVGRGIHYHMQIARSVDFIARDRQRQEIAWVGVKNGDGSLREFSNEFAPLTDEERETLEVRTMECIDCHNRNAHVFRSPVDVVNGALRSGALPSDLPYLKEAAVRALDGDYEDVGQARAGIEVALREYYEEQDPDVLDERTDDVSRVAYALRTLYTQSIFPEMKADWSAHPNNISHRDSDGCFRCHNDEMVDDEGNRISAECSICHAVLAQDDQSIQTMAEFEKGMGFIHPQDGGSFEEFSRCSDCHTGGKELYD